MAKRKVASKKRGKKNPLHEITLELETIAAELRTSTVTFSKERILDVVKRLNRLEELQNS